MDRKKVILGYSGGVDSAAAINILQEQGFEVIALTLDMCGDINLVDKARKGALNAGVTFASVNCEEMFQREIKDYFIAEYMSGRTPAPCTRCNPLIKWHLLAEYAAANNIYHIATGHYFKIVKHNDKLYVARPTDSRKDQSYYLWGLSQEILKRAITPMSGIIKDEINTQKRKESMGVCFLSGIKYSDYITNIIGETPHGGIINKRGEVVGRHIGIAHYTIGQKRGIGIPAGSVIIGLDNSCNSLIVGEDKDLYHNYLYIEQCNIVDTHELLNSSDISVMIRGIGRNPEGYALMITEWKSGYKISLSSPAWACAPGQPVVLYREDRVIGGGYLEFSHA